MADIPAASTAPLFHMVSAEVWDAAKAGGQPYFPPTYASDGFIHLTADPAFLLGVANHFYKDTQGAWRLLVLDPTRLKAKVVFEAAAAVGTTPAHRVEREDGSAQPEQPLFPHLYGTIDYDAVVKEVEIVRAPDGTFLSIPGY